MDDSEDIALFQQLQSQQQRPPARSGSGGGGGGSSKAATLADVLHTSSDPHAQAVAKQASGSDVEFLLSLLSSSDAAVLEAATDALWKLIINSQIRATVHRLGGTRSLLALLGHKEPRVQRVAAGACGILALEAELRDALV